MDSSSSIGRSGLARKTFNTRRSWTVKEEQVLVFALKDLVLRVDPLINSKIHVWKKNYGSLSIMLSRSGFGWNDVAHTLDVQVDEVWDNYVKKDNNTHTMQYKAWSYYKDWCDIFGKDMVIGENAEAFADVMQDLLTSSKRKQPDKGFEEHVPVFDGINEEPDYSSICHGESSASEKTQLVDLAKRIGFEQDACASTKTVFYALGHMNFMSVEDKIYVAKQLCNNTKDIDLLFNLPNEMKGVKYDKEHNIVTMDGSYWSHVELEITTHRFFRANGFLHYETCLLIFHYKDATKIDFRDERT
ncbi:hypothetical protein Pfo_011587 [Paulownia fortunei]|nr:hypothetical protein Pfo_011587 [Paulownia fortunei]